MIAERNWTQSLTGAQIAFPIAYRFPFFARSLMVTNRSSTAIYVSRTRQNPTAQTADATIPPYAAVPLLGWDSWTLYLGGTTQTLTTAFVLIQATDSPSPSVFAPASLATLQPYDRNPTTIVRSGSGSGGATVWTYTVPVGRLCAVESLSGNDNTSAGGAQVRLTVGATTVTVFAGGDGTTSQISFWAGELILSAGNVLFGVSVGNGSVWFAGLEYDA